MKLQEIGGYTSFDIDYRCMDGSERQSLLTSIIIDHEEKWKGTVAKCYDQFKNKTPQYELTFLLYPQPKKLGELVSPEIYNQII